MDKQDLNLNWKMATKAGEGVMLAAKLFAKACKRSGLNAFNYYEYPSLIKGGHQTGQVYASTGNARCQRRHLDLLILFHEKFLPLHLDALDENSLIVFNGKNFDASKYPDLKAKVLAIPMTKIARQIAGTPLAANVVALGVSACLLGLDLSILANTIKDEFAGKKELTLKNLEALKTACDQTQQLMAEQNLSPLKNIQEQADEQILLTGNEAVGLGALSAGLQFYSAYPMTPASGLLHYLASQQENYPLVVKHSEDEIGAINHALGASFAGVRAMTGSSGGGYALMVEATALAGVAELPLVILEAMRQGPATGLPTWTSQADLNFVINAGHGDFTKIVLTPGTMQEHFEHGRLAIELAEKYQLPVFILSDKYLLESHQTIAKPEVAQNNSRYGLVEGDENYQRYSDTETGISPRVIPGESQAVHLTNSYDHDQLGFATEEADLTKQAVDKRLKKLPALMQDLPKPQVFGADPKMASKILVSFGSTINVLQDMLAEKSELATTISVIHLPCVAPFLTQDFEALLDLGKINVGQQELITVEGTATGQLATLIQANSGVTKIKSLLRYDGRPFYLEDLDNYLTDQTLSAAYKVKE